MANDLKEIILAFLKASRWKQRDLAKEAGIHESHLSRILGDDSPGVQADTRARLLEAIRRYNAGQPVGLPHELTADFTVEDILKMKLDADFDRSAISSPHALISARHI